MFRLVLAFGLALLTCQSVLAADYSSYRYYHRHYLPPPRHVIEVVQPPYSGIFIINGVHFAGMSESCLGWIAGDRIRLIEGDWHGHCVTAVFYNYRHHNTCETMCRGAYWGFGG